MRTELHFHLLPDIDDGPRDDAEAVALARLAVVDGTGCVVATPHVRALDLAELPLRVEHLRAHLGEAGVPLEVLAGGELSPDDVESLTQDQLESLAHGPFGRRWLLLEAPLWPTEPTLPEAADELRERGFGILIAHPERSPSTAAADLRRQVSLGAVLQINASSLAGIHGARTERAALEIARSGLPFVVSSDAHSRARPPLLSAGAGALAGAGVDAGVIRAAVDTGPVQLLQDGLPEPLAVPAATDQ